MNRVTGTHREHGRATPLRPPPRSTDLEPRRDRRSPWVIWAGLAVVAAGGIVAFRALERPGIDATVASGVATPPRVMVPRGIAPSVPGFVSSLRGLVDNTATLTANGSPVALEAGGAFTILIPQGTAEVRLVATSAAGASHEAVVAVTDVPAPPTYPATAALHVRAEDWATPVIRQQILDLAAAGRINAVELDIKDEAGAVGYTSAVPLAVATGATAAGHYDARQAIDELHATGVRVIGRIVCFLDPVLAGWAWDHGRSDMLVLDGAGAAPLANGYGAAAFTNLASAEVRQYQIDLAVEAAGLGFDEILYDYVRRPEGSPDTMHFPGLDMAADVSVARFVAETDTRLRGTGALLGVSVFGISATRPEPTAQDVSLLAPHVDYLAPMVYPSHWGPGEYGVADPVRQPADIVGRSVADFERLVAGAGTAVVPWLQDFSSGDVVYGPLEVRAQIDAARAAGVEGFLLWNPASTYSVDALDPPTD